MLHDAIVITGDRACADIGFLANVGIADIREVVGLGARPENGVFDFDKIADMGVVPELGPRT